MRSWRLSRGQLCCHLEYFCEYVPININLTCHIYLWWSRATVQGKTCMILVSNWKQEIGKRLIAVSYKIFLFVWMNQYKSYLSYLPLSTQSYCSGENLIVFSKQWEREIGKRSVMLSYVIFLLYAPNDINLTCLTYLRQPRATVQLKTCTLLVSNGNGVIGKRSIMVSCEFFPFKCTYWYIYLTCHTHLWWASATVQVKYCSKMSTTPVPTILFFICINGNLTFYT